MLIIATYIRLRNFKRELLIVLLDMSAMKQAIHKQLNLSLNYLHIMKIFMDIIICGMNVTTSM